VNVLFITSEATPYSKTGGLGDVCGSLPQALASQGVRATLVLPAFRCIYEPGLEIEATDVEFEIPVGQKMVRGQYLRGRLPDSDVTVYFVKNQPYYDRSELYNEAGKDYDDNSERFTFFCRAALEAIPRLGLDIDVVHAHDWTAGLVPAYLKSVYADHPQLGHLPSIMTIHNLAYQGNFWHWDMALTGIDWKHFNHHEMEYYGQLSFLKTGIAFADAVTTVSPTYAEEILDPPLSCGFDGVLQSRREDLSGIINGVDYSAWSPVNDKFLGENTYNADTWQQGKPKCKAELQRRMNLPERADVPLLAAVGRLADQKGFDLIARVMRDWAEQQIDAQWVILGTGDPKFHTLLGDLAEQFPERIAVRLEFSNELAHVIEAGADMFLMPSQYEPCGLNQLYSLQYGTVPVVRETGGLNDTVTNAHEETIENGSATGFTFYDYTAYALSETLHRACGVYHSPDTWAQIVETGMREDWSWNRSAAEYRELYERTLARKLAAV